MLSFPAFLNILVLCTITSATQEIEIVALNSLKSSSGKTISGAQWIAIQEINNNTDLLPNYHLSLKIYDTQAEMNLALAHVLTVLGDQDSSDSCPCDNSTSNDTATRFPILLGISRSSHSTLVASVLGVNYLGLMSSVSTSVSLSDRDTYPYFYRSIASDALQSKGIVYLCNQFNWKSIVVVYANDAYGLYLSLGIQEMAKFYDIDVSSVAIQYEDDITYLYAARQVKALEKYIIVVIHNSGGIVDLFTAFDDEGLLGYPYYYIGVDTWIDSSEISDEFGDKVEGFIGTLPWHINQLELSAYDDEIMDVINTASVKTNALLAEWDYLYSTNGARNASGGFQLLKKEPRTYVVYAYDVMYSIAHLIEAVETIYGVGSLVDIIENNSSQEVMDLLHVVMTQHVDFLGASGHVKFTPNGDRENGFFTFGNIVDTGDVNYFGYFLETTEAENVTGLDSIQAHIDVDKIVWPSYFTEKGIIPHSQMIITESILTIDEGLFMFIAVVCGLLIAFVLFAFVFTLCKQTHVIIKRGSPHMNCVMYVGCVLSFVAAILFGLDERVFEDDMAVMCQSRLFLIVISFTITVMPLFFKTWRLVQIFSDVTHIQRITDTKLLGYIVVCILIDVVLVCLPMFIGNYTRVYHNGSLDRVDTLQHVQNVYGVCWFEKKDGATVFFLIVLIAWKTAQLLFAIYCALNVGRILNDPKSKQNVISRLMRFDETGAQLGSIALTFIIICIAVLIAALIGPGDPSATFAIIAITILLIGVIVFLLNSFMRIVAVLRNDTDLSAKYNKSMEEQFKATLKEKLIRIETALQHEESNVISVSGGETEIMPKADPDEDVDNGGGQTETQD